MRNWGRQSAKVYSELDSRLQRVLDRTLKEVANISLLDGHRDEAKQTLYYTSKPQRSKVPWPLGKHNKKPSLACDWQPYPRPKKEKLLWAALGYIAGRMIQIGIEEGVELRWGGDWDRDGNLINQTFYDLFHIEIVGNIGHE